MASALKYAWEVVTFYSIFSDGGGDKRQKIKKGRGEKPHEKNVHLTMTKTSQCFISSNRIMKPALLCRVVSGYKLGRS